MMSLRHVGFLDPEQLVPVACTGPVQRTFTLLTHKAAGAKCRRPACSCRTSAFQEVCSQSLSFSSVKWNGNDASSRDVGRIQ